MKTLVSLILLGTMLAFAPSVTAGGKKAPKNLCLEWESESIYHQLSIEQTGKIYDRDNRLKTYVITGIDQYGIITGSGYIPRGSTTLLATYGGMHNGDTLSTYQLQYNITTKSGTIDYRYDVPPGDAIITGTDRVYFKGCRQLEVPPAL